MIAITGATGQLGRLVIASLVRQVPAKNIVALVRDPSKASDFKAQGIDVRSADYNQPATLDSALQGVEKLLLISGNELGKRATQHNAVIAAAQKAGVAHIVYTSVLKASSSALPVVAEHLETEKALRESGIAYTLLRNTWYTENYTGNVDGILASGIVLHATQGKRIAPATRADLAEAAARVLAEAGHENKTYELNGDEAFTLADFAAAISKAFAKNISAQETDAENLTKVLESVGVPKLWADFQAATDLAIAQGALEPVGGDLAKLLGRPTQTLSDVLVLMAKNH